MARPTSDETDDRPDVKITISVPPELLEALDREASGQERSRSSMVRLILRDALTRKAG